MIKKCYEILGLISFLTAGTLEARAWTIKKGTLSPRLQGRSIQILKKNLLRQIFVPMKISWLQRVGWRPRSWESVSAGRDYEMKDGDVVELRLVRRKSSFFLSLCTINFYPFFRFTISALQLQDPAPVNLCNAHIRVAKLYCFHHSWIMVEETYWITSHLRGCIRCASSALLIWPFSLRLFTFHTKSWVWGLLKRWRPNLRYTLPILEGSDLLPTITRS